MADQGLIPIYTTQFTSLLQLKLQQMGSLLRGKVDVYSGYVGKQASPMNQLAAVVANAPQGRFAPKVNTPQSFTRRWVFPVDKEIDQYFDNFDKLQTIVDPQGKAAENAAQAIGRAYDDAIIAAATGTAQTGSDAGDLSSETFDTSTFRVAENFASSANNGLTVAKIIEARRILRHYHNNLEQDPVTLLIGSQQEADLFNQIQVTSKLYNADAAASATLVDGRITRIMGCDVVVSERVTQTTADSVRGALMFVKSGIHLGIWQDMKTQIFQRPDLSSNPWDVSTVATFGATRTQPGKVIQILCADTTGADITN